jgi:RNA polymerase sigma-70 factor (ECF subfamily)
MGGRRIKRYGVMALDALTDANQDRPFADLVTPLVPAAQRLAYGMLQNAHDSEDAVQEATFKAWRAFPRLREGSNHRAWFLTIVANECKQRRRNRWWSILKLAAPDHQDPAPQGLDGTSMDLRRAVARLPADMKLAIVLRYYLDLEFEDIGRVMRVSDKAAKARVHRALIRLRVDAGEMLNDA